jgi:pyruvate-ferredoxin/flavodoxin oxidoreductase
VLKVSLYRPWSEKHFLDALPKSIKKICVLDKTREEGGVGNPLYLDTLATLNKPRHDIKIVSGTYGLASKNFTPGQISSIFTNLELDEPRHHFTVGIEDDVTHTSLEVKRIPESTI